MANYAEHHDLVRLNGVFNALIAGYRDDVEKYADKQRDQDAIRYILNYGCTFAAHRIQFSKFTGTTFKSSDVGNAFRTLEKTLLLELVYPQTSVAFPILPDLRKSPKLMWLDTGLVNYVAGQQEELLFTQDSDELWNGPMTHDTISREGGEPFIYITSQCTMQATSLHSSNGWEFDFFLGQTFLIKQ